MGSGLLPPCKGRRVSCHTFESAYTSLALAHGTVLPFFYSFHSQGRTGVMLLQECAGVAQVVSQAGRERLLAADGAGGNACARPGQRAASGQIPPAHQELLYLLQGAPDLLWATDASGKLEAQVLGDYSCSVAMSDGLHTCC